MRLLLLDIDGTLTDTNDVDDSCFVQAVRDVFAISDVNTDWSTYEDATDSSITDHLVRNRLRRAVCDAELAEMKERFHSLLFKAFSDDPALCQPIPGGPQFLDSVIARADCAVAFATGGWERAARLKLRTAGYRDSGIPMASADDSHRRVDICSIAIHRSLAHYGVTAFDPVVYIGDGVWDARAAASLGCKFIGIGTDHSAALKHEGAELVVPDFSGTDLLDHLLGVTKRE